MHIYLIDEQTALAPQLLPAHIPAIAEAGFEQIICNRPDSEEAYQPSIAAIQAEADKHALKVIYAPISGSDFTPEAIAKTQAALDSGKKTVMFCRSGTRCSILWAIIQVKAGVSADAAIAQTAAVGFDNRYLKDFIVGTAKQ